MQIDTLPMPLEIDSSVERCYRQFRRWGDFTLGYSTLQNGLKYFETKGGYIAYDTKWGIPFVLADPVAPPAMRASLVRAYLNQFPNCCFCAISKPTAAVLNECGLFVNEIGSEMTIDLPSYRFDGHGKCKLRQAARKIEREGYAILELNERQVDRLAVESLSQNWRAKKRVKREVRFLTRPVVFEDEPGVRKFYLVAPGGNIVAFVYFDPICREGEVVGYSSSIKRRLDRAPTGAEEAITKFAIERFQDEGREVLSLGLLPLYDVQDGEFHHNRRLKRFFQLAYHFGDRLIYSFAGHADFKHRFRGDLHKMYFATYRKINVVSLIALMRLCRIF